MTPEQWSAFLEVHKDLPREGPGAPEDVHWALDRIGISGSVDVFDAGCATGGDTVTLAQALSEARIRAVDTTEPFVAHAQARLAPFGDRVRVELGSMAEPGGTYDLIWCAGALYFLGVTEGLTLWRDALKPGGHVAFSEPVALRPLSADAAAFWEEYPQITDLAGIEARVSAAGYRVLDHRMIVGAPWLAYYDPMQARIDHLQATNTDPVIAEAMAECQCEIDLWHAARDEIAYALLIVAPE
ncbi:class I SAM-dependent methyltransferase [uncultured Tateyamaria sp.]|uniref:class I SAM-dependent methyltransferase n=1 Tax=uncultured Tateyamaria sp. TaxID=455651 RepID=UPI0026382553|nr:class I SAM-dependent methyltransferase [uncultured Tateyamaria sp.]